MSGRDAISKRTPVPLGGGPCETVVWTAVSCLESKASLCSRQRETRDCHGKSKRWPGGGHDCEHAEVSRKAQELQNLRSGDGVGDKDPKSTRKEQEAKANDETVVQEAGQGQGGAPKSYKCGLVPERGWSVW